MPNSEITYICEECGRQFQAYQGNANRRKTVKAQIMPMIICPGCQAPLSNKYPSDIKPGYATCVNASCKFFYKHFSLPEVDIELVEGQDEPKAV